MKDGQTGGGSSKDKVKTRIAVQSVAATLTTNAGLATVTSLADPNSIAQTVNVCPLDLPISPSPPFFPCLAFACSFHSCVLLSRTSLSLPSPALPLTPPLLQQMYAQPIQYAPTMVQAINNPDGTVSIIGIDPSSHGLVTLADGTQAQVRTLSAVRVCLSPASLSRA